MRGIATWCGCLAALTALAGCGSGSTAEAGMTEAVVARVLITVDGKPTGDDWVAIAGLGGRVEPVETIDGASGETRYAPGQLRWGVIRLTRDLPGPTPDVVEGWIDASFAGRKPEGVMNIRIVGPDGEAMSQWNIERWHVEAFQIGPFSSKESSDLGQTLEIRTERVLRIDP